MLVGGSLRLLGGWPPRSELNRPSKSMLAGVSQIDGTPDACFLVASEALRIFEPNQRRRVA